MTDTIHNIPLPGCTPEPLMSYLKALGILRLVSEQKDSEARGWWRNDVFWLRSPALLKSTTTDAGQEEARDVLARFFLEEYKPTPMFSPWNGDGGFLSDSGTSVDTIKAIRGATAARLKSIQDAIGSVEQIPLMAEFRKKRDRSKELEKKKKSHTLSDKEEEEIRQINARVKQIKRNVVNGIRTSLPDGSLNWLDTCMTLNMDGFSASPLLGSGGVDGRLDFGTNFLGNIQVLLTDQQAAVWLHQSLFGKGTHLAESSIGQFSPGQIGGPNGAQGFKGTSLINPWDFVLMMEGTLLLAGAAVRRFDATGQRRASFPFTVRAVAAGFDSPASKDEAESRGELWLPLWTRPASLGELHQLFGEGRAEVSGRPARDGPDFARAVAGLGVDRGVSSFARMAFLKRSGKAFLATPLGRFEVSERESVDLLRQIDPWLDRFRRAVGDKNSPPRFGTVLRHIDSAVFDFCRYGGKPLFQRVLITLGQTEKGISTAERFRSEKGIKPITGLSPDWLDAADDQSPEFSLALALASVDACENKIGPLRTNLESVDWSKRCRAWTEKDRAVVWNAADLATNLASVLQRRIMDGQRQGCEHLPLASAFAASLDAVAGLIEAELDERRIEDLLWGLMLIEGYGLNPPSQSAIGSSKIPLPRDYALLKLLFLPRPLAADRKGDRITWRLAREGEPGITIRPEPRILPLLRAGRVGEACRISTQRLRISGLQPMPGPLPAGNIRDADWAELPSDPRRAHRLAAALLIPIGSGAVNQLVQLVCRSQTNAAEAIATISKGESQ
jgi:CRISPR-associated protein Csx17